MLCLGAKRVSQVNRSQYGSVIVQTEKLQSKSILCMLLAHAQWRTTACWVGFTFADLQRH